GLERLLHDDTVLVGNDHAGELGNPASGRTQVQRSYVDQRLFDRNHHQRSPDDLRTLLIPERDLRRNDLILRDSSDDLTRTEHELLLREFEHEHLAVMLTIAAC